MILFKNGKTIELPGHDAEFQAALDTLHAAEQKLHEATELYLDAANKRYEAAKAYVDAMVRDRKGPRSADRRRPGWPEYVEECKTKGLPISCKGCSHCVPDHVSGNYACKISDMATVSGAKATSLDYGREVWCPYNSDFEAVTDAGCPFDEEATKETPPRAASKPSSCLHCLARSFEIEKGEYCDFVAGKPQHIDIDVAMGGRPTWCPLDRVVTKE